MTLGPRILYGNGHPDQQKDTKCLGYQREEKTWWDLSDLIFDTAPGWGECRAAARPEILGRMLKSLLGYAQRDAQVVQALVQAIQRAVGIFATAQAALSEKDITTELSQLRGDPKVKGIVVRRLSSCLVRYTGIAAGSLVLNRVLKFIALAAFMAITNRQSFSISEVISYLFHAEEAELRMPGRPINPLEHPVNELDERAASCSDDGDKREDVASEKISAESEED